MVFQHAKTCRSDKWIIQNTWRILVYPKQGMSLKSVGTTDPWIKRSVSWDSVCCVPKIKKKNTLVPAYPLILNLKNPHVQRHPVF